MKIKHLLALAVATASMTGGAQAAGNLNIYNWSGYISPDLVKKFEEQNDVKVTIDSYDSDETLLAKLQQGGAGYDIAVTGNYMLPVMIEQGLVENVGIGAEPEYKNIIDSLQNPEWDAKGEYSVPWQWGSTNFAVNTKELPNVDSFGTLFEPPAAAQGKFNMFDSVNTVMAQASIYLGIPQCSEDPKELQKVLDLLKQQKPSVRSYSSKSGAIREQLVSGEIVMSPLYSGSSMRARELNADIQYIFPKEGLLAWVDTAFVPKGAANPENAKAFLKFILDPENAAMNSNYLKYQNGIKGSEAYLDAALRDAPEMNPPADIPVVYQKTCSEKAIQLQDRVWTALMK